MDTQMDKGNVTNCYKLLNLGGAYTNVHYSKCQLFCGFKLFHDNKLGYNAEQKCLKGRLVCGWIISPVAWSFFFFSYSRYCGFNQAGKDQIFIFGSCVITSY